MSEYKDALGWVEDGLKDLFGLPIIRTVMSL